MDPPPTASPAMLGCAVWGLGGGGGDLTGVTPVSPGGVRISLNRAHSHTQIVLELILS